MIRWRMAAILACGGGSHRMLSVALRVVGTRAFWGAGFVGPAPIGEARSLRAAHPPRAQAL